MKFLKALSIFSLVLVLFTLTSCNNINTIKKDFEKNGYTYLNTNEGTGKEIEKELKEDGIEVEVHMFKKSLNFAIVIEFKSTKDLNSFFEDSETVKGLIKDLEKSDLVRGNNLLIPIS